MSGSSKKARKLQQRRNRRRRELAHLEARKEPATGSSAVTQLRFDEPETNTDIEHSKAWETLNTTDVSGHVAELLDDASEREAPRPKRREKEKDAVDLWWEEYDGADGSTRMEMTRAKLKSIPVDDDCSSRFFPEAVDELESKLPRGQFVAFLEEVREVRHDVFLLSADWYTRAMVFHYLAHDRLEDVDHAVIALAAELEDVSDPFFSLMSTIRLAGRAEAAQKLIDSATARLKDSSLMYWAVEEILEWALFPHYQRCVAAGAADDAMEELHIAAGTLGIEDSTESEANRCAFALHLSGRSDKRWATSELICDKSRAFRNIYLLNVDYVRWLSVKRGVEPLVADEFRRLVNAAINGINCPFNAVLFGLTRRVFEPHLARKLGFMSLDWIHAPATVVAMRHYFDFLKELELVKPGDWQKSQSTCDSLWKELQKTLANEWQTYRFLERYLPA